MADYSAYKVRSIGSDGIISTVLGTGVTGNDADGSPATSCKIGFSTIFVDSSSILYYVVNNWYVVRKVTSSGTVLTIAGNTGLITFNGNGLAATSSSIYSASSIWSDTTGVLIICDSGHYRIRSVVAGLMYTIAGSGFSGSVNGNDGYATAASVVRYPLCLEIQVVSWHFLMDLAM